MKTTGDMSYKRDWCPQPRTACKNLLQGYKIKLFINILSKKIPSIDETVDQSIFFYLQLEPAPAFRCVTAAEAEEIGKRLYAGHRNKNSNKDQKANKNDNGKTAANKSDSGNGNGRTTANKNGSQTAVSVAI